MNISYKWLKDYVDFNLTPQEVCDALTSIGLEVGGLEEQQTIKGGLKGLVIGEVLTCEAHPNSDHLHVCTVDLGEGEPQQIVCGAPNVAAGQKVVVATIGCKLYDGDEEFVIKKSKLRGVPSNGMICAEDEIGIGTDHQGIIVLPQDAVVGTPAAEYYHVESDYVIEVDITPNRSDACSHYGVARDLYAWLLSNGKPATLHRPDYDAFKIDNHDLDISVEVEDEEKCPRYCAVTLKGCEVKESPEWLQNRLRTIGLRPINNIVDITNYIMFAYGQPLHCFDADMIEGGKVIVKSMPNGTPFVTLDGVEHKLSHEDITICNVKDAMCIAGVFGGKGSGTYESTTNVLFESAYFNPTSIRKSARRHGLSTDASFRFERGIDPNGQIYALKQAAILAQQLAGGTISMEIKDTHPQGFPGFEVKLDYQYVYDLIGERLHPEVIRNIVESLEMQVVEENSEGLKLIVPPYRTDVTHPCDVVEDILRIYGYNNIEIPASLNSTLTIKGETDRSNKLQNLIAEQLVGAGFNEILNNSLTRKEYYSGLETFAPEHCVTLMNPLSEDLNVMRQSLLFGGLESLKRNINYRNTNLRFFEFGNCYSFDASQHHDEQSLSGYSEMQYLGLWITGKCIESSWAHADEDANFYQLKAYVENILSRLGLSIAFLKMEEVQNDIFSQALQLVGSGKKVLATFGVVNPKLTARFEITAPVYFAELNWTYLMQATRKNRVLFHEISNFPAVSRDLALLVDTDVTFLQIETVAYSTEKKLLKKVELFDVYEGKNLPAGKKSYAVNFVLQDETRTLNDKQIDKVMQSLIRNLQNQLGATLR